jgi:putative ubiquitin-RnfH superfamily antitoxin RatB of RatAB toxin-antitoxin module
MTLENALMSSMDAEQSFSVIAIEVTYATPEKQVLLRLSVRQGTTVAEGIEQSTIRDEFPDLEMDISRVGIFSRKVSLDYVLREGDRIEIYRPLLVDPKEVRRQKAKSEEQKAKNA